MGWTNAETDSVAAVGADGSAVTIDAGGGSGSVTFTPPASLGNADAGQIIAGAATGIFPGGTPPALVLIGPVAGGHPADVARLELVGAGVNGGGDQFQWLLGGSIVAQLTPGGAFALPAGGTVDSPGGITSGPLAVTGGTTTDTLHATGAATLDNSATVAGIVNANGGLAVTGSVAFNGTPLEVGFTALALTSGWANRGAGYPTFGYRTNGGAPNQLQLAGELVAGTVTSGTIIATLPAGYRPATAYTIICRQGANAYGALTVGTDGTIRAYDFSASGAIVQFPPANIPLDW